MARSQVDRRALNNRFASALDRDDFAGLSTCNAFTQMRLRFGKI
jgi:hypothetical protein